MFPHKNPMVALGLIVSASARAEFLYAANQGSNNISVYLINTDGSLTPIGTFPTGKQ